MKPRRKRRTTSTKAIWSCRRHLCTSTSQPPERSTITFAAENQKHLYFVANESVDRAKKCGIEFTYMTEAPQAPSSMADSLFPAHRHHPELFQLHPAVRDDSAVVRFLYAEKGSVVHTYRWVWKLTRTKS
ncbi:hypothetical protein RP20_CCG022897 [Aedes albopictus]|nr:hypothetical protein RP20_CCG022897 [Aedes albopictus]